MKPRYKAHGVESRLRNYIKLDDLGAYIKQKYNGYRLTEQTVEFCMKMAAGADAISAVKEVYTLQENNAQAKRQAKEMLGNPKIIDTINIIRENVKHNTIVDTNSILSRLELIYSECINDNDRANALKVLKQMADIVTKMDGEVNVGEVNITFQLPNVKQVKKIEIEAKDIEEDEG